ncbi:MAG: DUF3261 domain-containing protein [Saprospiraceae bacterium]|nr:DUF3261 domain-containing protein [Saprospiraceae bacterium]
MLTGRFTILRVLTLLPVVLFFYSCSNAYQDLIPVEAPAHSFQPAYPFDFSVSNPVIYDLAIKTKKQYFSGLFILKNEGPQQFRLAMTSKLGNKLFDMTFDNGQFTVHQIIEPMNKKVLINMMQSLFTLMLEKKDLPDHTSYFKNQNMNKVYRWKEKGDWKTVMEDEEGKVMAYHSGNKKKPAVTIDFKGYKNGHPAQIELVNSKWVRFEMLFSQLDQK